MCQCTYACACAGARISTGAFMDKLYRYLFDFMYMYMYMYMYRYMFIARCIAIKVA